MGKKLILAGGGHAHMTILAHLRDLIRDGHDVTVVQPSDYHYYSGMAFSDQECRVMLCAASSTKP